MDAETKQQIKNLIETAQVSCLGSVDKQGFPNIKAMMNIQRDGLFIHYFSTFLYAERTAQYLKNPKACIYLYTLEDPKGIMLIGDMQVLTDKYHKQLLWRDGFEKYYPEGIETENYCILKFTATHGDFCYGPGNIVFNVTELSDIS